MAPHNRKICERKAAKKKNRIWMAPQINSVLEEKKVGGGRAGCSGKKRREAVVFEKHIYEVAKEENPELEITVNGIELMNEMMNDVLYKIVEEAEKNATASNQKSLNIKDLKAAVRKLFPGDLARYANLHGYVTCTTFEAHLAHEQAINEGESQELADCLHQVKI